MKVNLKCVYGNKHPRNNPHELDEKVAKKLIDDGLAEETDKSVSSNAKLEAELEATKLELEEAKKTIAELEAKVAEKVSGKK